MTRVVHIINCQLIDFLLNLITSSCFEMPTSKLMTFYELIVNFQEKD